MTLHPLRAQLRTVDPVLRTGRVRKIAATHVEASGPNVPLGTLCSIEAHGGPAFAAEIAGIDADRVTLAALEDGRATFAGARVTARADAASFPAGPALLGRVVDALARPLDGLKAPRGAVQHPLHAPAPAPLDRASPANILETGIRAIDGLLTLGKGQRVGIFAASGVGKTSFMTQIARQASADVTILCVVGERGREVEALWNRGLDAIAREHTTLVAATSDQTAAMRVRACYAALALADYWRGQGKHVLLVLDSVTRLAMALREIGLAAGEPPTLRAYTPNVFAAIPKIVERCGAVRGGGAITAIMTVLSEGDEIDDPLSEMMKSLLDGHILLSRSLAEQGQFPAIDVLRSISRQANELPGDRRPAQQVVEWLNRWTASRTLVEAGLYARGSDPAIDQAIERQPAIQRFLKQGRDERVALTATVAALGSLMEGRA
jgi:flagellum-specific ATP synthase